MLSINYRYKIVLLYEAILVLLAHIYVHNQLLGYIHLLRFCIFVKTVRYEQYI